VEKDLDKPHLTGVLYFQEISALKKAVEQMRAHHDKEIKRLVQTHQEELAALKHELEGLQKVPLL
jgi:anti-sigma-K factor RskA